MDEALPHFDWSVCATGVVCADPGNNFPGEQCCYVVTVEPCVGGRPLRIAGKARIAAGDGCASGWRSAGSVPQTGGLDAATREVLARHWTRDALFEHASVASFSRFALELLAVGAPGELVEGAHAAALDEIRHARLCFGLAAAYGADAAPSGLALPDKLDVATDLAAAAAAAVVDGCVGETMAACVAAEQHSLARDPAVKSVLEEIASDEARHAELAWRFVAWALAVGDDRVYAAVGAAFERALRSPPVPAALERGRACAHGLSSHGCLDASALAAAAQQALVGIVSPSARALLARRTEAGPTSPDQRAA